MPVEGGPAGRAFRGNTLLRAALRFAGYDVACRPTAATATTTTPAQGIESPPAAAGAVSAGGRYMHKLPAELESTRALLEEYSGIPADDVDRHVYEIRDRLWDVYPYACVGHFRFASLEFAADIYYQQALARLLSAQETETASSSPGGDITRLLDVGCCVGQVLRKLAHDGVDSSRLYGTDVEPRFLDLGFDLFRDRATFRGRFVVGDLLLPPPEPTATAVDNDGDDGPSNSSGSSNSELDALDGSMTLVHATSFFHLFTWAEQVRAATRIVRLLRADGADVMVFGRQVGTAAPRASGKAGSDKVYLHDGRSWQKLWDEVGARTGTRWRAAMAPTEKIQTGAAESSLRKMTFCVVRG